MKIKERTISPRSKRFCILKIVSIFKRVCIKPETKDVSKYENNVQWEKHLPDRKQLKV